MNRSTIFDFLLNKSGLINSYEKISNGAYPIFVVPYKWDYAVLLVNGSKIITFEKLILFSSELVVKFETLSDSQVNIPYKDIEYIEVRQDMHIGYMGLHNGKVVEY